jgi:hypothetical protein
MKAPIDIPKHVFTVLNQVFELERKLSGLNDSMKFDRSLAKLREAFDSQEMQFIIENPLHQRYDITRTDVVATISSSEHDELVITEVLKPVIKVTSNGVSRIIQKGVVIAGLPNAESQ